MEGLGWCGAPQLCKQPAGREQRRQAGLDVGRGALQEAVLQHDVRAAEAAAARLQARRPLCGSVRASNELVTLLRPTSGSGACALSAQCVLNTMCLHAKRAVERLPCHQI